MAAIFDEIADFLETKMANLFSMRAYRNAASSARIIGRDCDIWLQNMKISQRHRIAGRSLSMGVLIGADILRLGSIRKLCTPLAFTGGGGIFDGIFLSGLIAVLPA